MKFASLADASTASALQLAWLHQALEPVSEFGRRAYARVAPFRPGEETQAQERAGEIASSAQTFSAEQIDAMRDALRISPDPLPALSRAGMGEVLDDAQLLELLRFLDAAQRIEAIAPQFLTEPVREAVRLLESGRAGKFGFYLSDNADAALGEARARADRAQAEFESARGRLAQRLAQALGREGLPPGEFIVMRDGASPLPSGVRVIREAPTYFLCELELDETALQALSKRDEANTAVAQAEARARERISSYLRERARPLESLMKSLGAFDVRLAQVRFAQTYACVAPEIVAENVLRFEDADYLPLKAELESAGRSYKSISIELSESAVLTGPNMGGKSVALRTCGFVAVLAAFGIPVPAKSAACALFDEIAWLGIGGQEEQGGLLSSFAREVVRLNEIWRRDASRPLVLVDEFARTTTPLEGKALLVSLMRALQRRGWLAFAATHLAGIAQQAGVRHFAVRGLRGIPKAARGGDLQAALAALAESMDYSVSEVRGDGARHADALALAALIGLDEDVVAEAAALLHDESETAWTP
jgi:hypothetical protein